MTSHRSDSFGRNAALVAAVLGWLAAGLRAATVEWHRGDAWRLLMMAGALPGVNAGRNVQRAAG